MTTLRAVDASFDPLTAIEALCLANSDTPLFAQCLWTATTTPAPRVISLREASNAGLMTAGYISLNRHGRGAYHIDRGREGVPDDLWQALKFVAVDIELDGIRVEEIVAACERVVTLGQRPIIYTNYNTWTSKIIPANSDVLARLGILLWNAYWDLHPDIDFPQCRFGGWRDDQVMLEQWSGGAHVCGTFVDRNTVIRELLLAGGEEPAPDYAKLKQEVDNLRSFFIASTNALDGRLGGIENGETLSDIEVPIWPRGLTSLRDIFHRGYYSLPIPSGLALIQAVRWLFLAMAFRAAGMSEGMVRSMLAKAEDALQTAEEEKTR